MKLFILNRRQFVQKPLSEVFAFFSNPENLETLTPKDLGFETLTPTPIAMKEGAVIDYTIKIGGFPVRWTTLITSYEPQHKFVDLQLKGPYSYWHHTHTFTETNDGTVIEDEVRYAMPLGILGLAAHALVVKRRLATIFARRSDVIKAIFPEAK
jgi:ligand-binding SRPBCC domain-containing protein